MAKYGYLLNDYQLMQYRFASRLLSPREDNKPWPRFFPGTIKPYNSTPQTVPLFKTASGGKYDLELSEEWEGFVALVNGSKPDKKGNIKDNRATKFLDSPPAGLRNKNRRWDSLGFGGNIVKIVGELNRAWEIEGIDIRNKPTKGFVPPYLVHRFTVVTKDNRTVNPANGIDVRVPLLCRGKLYVLKERVRLF